LAKIKRITMPPPLLQRLDHSLNALVLVEATSRHIHVLFSKFHDAR
ncbi:10579_t:CDS:2, partial [Gigaspora rosea]